MKNNRKEKITKEEVQGAINLQSPIKGEDVPRANTFMQLAKVSMSARIAFGGQSNWIQTEKLFRADYRNGDESVPFYIVRAFSFVKNNQDKLGVEFVLSNGKRYSVSLILHEGDTKRNQILQHFQNENLKRQPFGPCCFVKLDLGQPNPYYDIQAFVGANVITINDENIEPDIPFVEIPIDDDIPF